MDDDSQGAGSMEADTYTHLDVYKRQRVNTAVEHAGANEGDLEGRCHCGSWNAKSDGMQEVKLIPECRVLMFLVSLR